MPSYPDLCQCRVDQHRSDGVRRILRGAICIPDKPTDPLDRLPKLRFRPYNGEADGVPFTKDAPAPTPSETIWEAILTMFPDICPLYVRKLYDDLRKKRKTVPDGRLMVEAILEKESYPKREESELPRKHEETTNTTSEKKSSSYLDTARKLLKMDSAPKCTCGAASAVSPSSTPASRPLNTSSSINSLSSAAAASRNMDRDPSRHSDNLSDTASTTTFGATEKSTLPPHSITTTLSTATTAASPIPSSTATAAAASPDLTLLTYQPPRSNPSTACRGSYQPPWPTATPPLQGPGSYQPPWATAACPLVFGKPPSAQEREKGVANIFNWQLPCRRNPVY